MIFARTFTGILDSSLTTGHPGEWAVVNGIKIIHGKRRQ
jgi:hypothetical protein